MDDVNKKIEQLELQLKSRKYIFNEKSRKMPKYKIKELNSLENEEFVEANLPDSAIKTLLDNKLKFEVENIKNGNKWIFSFSWGRIYREE